MEFPKKYRDTLEIQPLEDLRERKPCRTRLFSRATRPERDSLACFSTALARGAGVEEGATGCHSST